MEHRKNAAPIPAPAGETPGPTPDGGKSLGRYCSRCGVNRLFYRDELDSGICRICLWGPSGNERP